MKKVNRMVSLTLKIDNKFFTLIRDTLEVDNQKSEVIEIVSQECNTTIWKECKESDELVGEITKWISEKSNVPEVRIVIESAKLIMRFLKWNLVVDGDSVKITS